MGCCFSSICSNDETLQRATGEMLQRECLKSKKEFLKAREYCQKTLKLEKIESVETEKVLTALKKCDNLCGRNPSSLSRLDKCRLATASSVLTGAAKHYIVTVNATVKYLEIQNEYSSR